MAQILLREDLAMVCEALRQQHLHDRPNAYLSSLTPEPTHQPETIIATVASVHHGFQGLILNTICSFLSPQDMLNPVQSCKGFSDDVVETLYRQHHSSAIFWACTRDTILPLTNCLRFNIPLDQHLDISRDIPFSVDSTPTAPVVLSKPSPLILALASSRLRAAEFLIEQRAAVNLPEGAPDNDDDTTSFLQSSRWYPIHFAVLLTQSFERADDALWILEKLLDHGASANQKTLEAGPFGISRTPLAQVMSSAAPLEALELLLAHGADPLTMLAWAGRGHRATRLLDILLQSGARQRRAAGGRGTGPSHGKVHLAPTGNAVQLYLQSTLGVHDDGTESATVVTDLTKDREMEMQTVLDSSRTVTYEVGTGTSSD
ncbi:hypothetical protein PG997_010411 [Apiospora hydei]|uniref:Ankyrin n=1 Tax=Apiospora hydei TaxID=1337664 RepID=A0ABR1VWX6_9PEZI